MCVCVCVCVNADAAVRLVGGTELSEGRVEVYHSGSWGTICDDFFDMREAQVICHQLGYRGGALEAIPNSRFGRGTGQIWMDNLRCTGNETNIGDCPFLGWGSHNCVHYEDAGVRCADGEKGCVCVFGRGGGGGGSNTNCCFFSFYFPRWHCYCHLCCCCCLLSQKPSMVNTFLCVL